MPVALAYAPLSRNPLFARIALLTSISLSILALTAPFLWERFTRYVCHLYVETRANVHIAIVPPETIAAPIAIMISIALVGLLFALVACRFSPSRIAALAIAANVASLIALVATLL